MNQPKIADYTTRKSYMQNYAANHRAAINAKKREWRAEQRRLSQSQVCNTAELKPKTEAVAAPKL